MEFRISNHAREMLHERGLSDADISEVLDSPEQVVEGDDGKTIYQSRKDFYGTLFLVRVIVEESLSPPLVVTAYMTTRIGKYWRLEDADKI